MRSALTYLYVPGDVPERFDKALASGTDAVVLDLEDAVTAANKDHARATVAAWVAACEPGDVQIWVRVNPGPLQEDDIRAVMHPNLTGIWLPKVSSAGEIEQADALLSGSSAVVSPLIETAAGVFAALEIARAPRVKFLQIGEVDLAADLGVDGSAESLSFVRAQVVAASVAAGIDPPPAAVSRNFRDADAFGFRAFSRGGARGQGVAGRLGTGYLGRGRRQQGIPDRRGCGSNRASSGGTCRAGVDQHLTSAESNAKPDARCGPTGAEDEVVPTFVAEHHLHRQEPESILAGEAGTGDLQATLIDDVFAVCVEHFESRGKVLTDVIGSRLQQCDQPAFEHAGFARDRAGIPDAAEDVEHVVGDSRILGEEQSGNDHRLRSSVS
jgi:hypothetical protein